MLVRGVVQDELDDDPEAARVGGVEKLLEVLERPVARMDAEVVGDVVTVVPQG